MCVLLGIDELDESSYEEVLTLPSWLAAMKSWVAWNVTTSESWLIFCLSARPLETRGSWKLNIGLTNVRPISLERLYSNGGLYCKETVSLLVRFTSIYLILAVIQFGDFLNGCEDCICQHGTRFRDLFCSAFWFYGRGMSIKYVVLYVPCVA